MTRARVVWKMGDGSVESLDADEVDRRIRELMRRLKEMLIEADAKSAAISEGRRAEDPTNLQMKVIAAIKDLHDDATNAEIRKWCLKKGLITPSVDSWDIGRVRASLLKKYSPRT